VAPSCQDLLALAGQKPGQGGPIAAGPLNPPGLHLALRRHQVRQDEERRTAGDLWQDFGLVFPNTVGRPMEPCDLLSDVYRPLLKRAGLPPVTFILFATRPQRCCWRRANIPRWFKSCLDMHRSASRWTATAT
jgi:hypothetical protein